MDFQEAHREMEKSFTFVVEWKHYGMKNPNALADPPKQVLHIAIDINESQAGGLVEDIETGEIAGAVSAASCTLARADGLFVELSVEQKAKYAT